MKTDDPRLEQARKEMIERRNKMDAIALAVVRGHLLIEQAMDDFLTASFFHPDHVLEGRFGFLHKAQMCRAMSLNQNEDQLWELLWRANELRNRIAHTLSADEIKKKMDRLRRGYMDVLTPEQAKGLEKQPDADIAQSAFALCAGFLVVLRHDAISRRRVIDAYWKPQQ